MEIAERIRIARRNSGNARDGEWILGVLITIGAAFAYDSSTGRATNGLTVASAEGHAPMVNWDVVSHDWDSVRQQLHGAALDIEKGWKRITG